MKTYRKFLAAVAMLAAVQTGQAEQWSLDSCVNYAVAHNINILQQQLKIKEGEQSVTEAKDKFLPSLDASASQSFNFGRALQQDNTYADRNTSNF